jgi:arylformamidase
MAIDLSLPLEEGMPGFPGYPGYETSQLQDYDPDGKVSHHVSMNTHQGTHIDAPAHFIEGGATVDELSLELLCGPARVVDLRAHRGEEITADVLESAAPDLAADRVLLFSGDVDARFYDPDFFEEAAVLTVDAARWLLEHDVKLVGNDFLTESIRVEERPVHHALLGEGVPIVEYLSNVEDVLAETTVEFRCLPLRLPGLEAAPVRAAVF